MSDWFGILEDLFRQINDGGITLRQMKLMLEHRDPFAIPLTLDWARVYQALGMEAKYQEFVEAHQQELQGSPESWIIPVLQGITCNRVAGALSKTGVHIDNIDDLDAVLAQNDRDPNQDGSYAVVVRRTIEADEENKHRSTNMLKKEGHQGITLSERLLLELGYFLTTDQHLDVKNVTLCTGSRLPNGHVPTVRYFFGTRKVHFDWCSCDRRIGILRSRSVVYLPADL